MSGCKLHQSHWSGWSVHDLQGDSSSAMLTANYGDRDSKKTTVIRVRRRTVFAAEHVKQHRCFFWNHFVRNWRYCILCDKNNPPCCLQQLNVLYLVYSKEKSTRLKSTAETWPHCHSSAKSPSRSITSVFAYVHVSQEWDVRGLQACKMMICIAMIHMNQVSLAAITLGDMK